MTRIGEPPAVVGGGTFIPADATVPDAPLARPVVPFAALDLQVHPAIAGGRLRARYRAVVTNAAATTVQARLSVAPGDGRVRAEILAPPVALEPGERYSADVVLRPRRPQLLRGE